MNPTFGLSIIRENSKYENSSYVLSDTLRVISDSTRHIFFIVFTIITIASVIGNLSVIAVICNRKYRYIQKTSIISLALSDFLSTAIISLNNLETFSHPLTNWGLGEFLCSFIPVCQMLGITASSVALVVIAMDRYRNVIHALSKKWNPSLNYCIICTLVLWTIIAGISYPMETFFSHEAIRIIYVNNGLATAEEGYLCAAFDKEKLTHYYVWMTIIIFLPLLSIFIWLYYNIAALIWRHRKPLSTNRNKNNQTDLERSSSNTKTTEISIKNFQDNQLKSIMMKNKNVRVERKIRTFKIILTIMIVFIICRLPYYIFYIVKLKMTPGGEAMWILNYTFIALNIVNCVLNPLLYTFLKSTLLVCGKIRKTCSDFTCKVCCCCFSNTEFEEFEKGSRVVVENFEQRKAIENCSELLKNKPNSQKIFDDDLKLQRYKQLKKY